jgi:hypothetical protein
MILFNINIPTATVVFTIFLILSSQQINLVESMCSDTANRNCRDEMGRVYMKTLMCRNMRVNHCLLKRDMSNQCNNTEQQQYAWTTTMQHKIDLLFLDNYHKICLNYDDGLPVVCESEDLVNSGQRDNHCGAITYISWLCLFSVILFTLMFLPIQ